MNELKIIRKEQKESDEQIKELKKTNEKMEKELSAAIARIELLERDKKKKNLVVTGFHTNTKDDKILREQLKDFITRNLEVHVKLNSAGRIGDKTFVMEMDCMSDKLTILKNKSKLRNIKEFKIYIDSDMTKKEREIQQRIRKRRK